MWQNEQRYFPYYQRNCSNFACLNPYCQCGEICQCNHSQQCHDGWGNTPHDKKQKVSLKSSMRLVWEQHVYWTRMTIISMVFGLPDVDSTTNRLLQNANDMGNLLKPFYGNKIAAMYSNLIREHLIIAAELVKAAKVGNQKDVAALERKWYENGKDVAEFLSRINPFISRDEFQKMWFEHLALTKQEAVFMLQQDFESSIAVFDKIEQQALEMADTITTGIAKQFVPLL
ncbi:acetylglutamate kinase [Sporosarcina aquimarina]|uniref:acetylglutamate kinase n=1 Tax=Sporosarcina aquimarina TaxID=114975 RepID=UPI00203A7852|nr:acetylglutamate kinase [Sporosarcina aquimarina]MCM3757377.1 acetylglutamate kinase [Sporosarcina aquimarina]